MSRSSQIERSSYSLSLAGLSQKKRECFMFDTHMRKEQGVLGQEGYAETNVFLLALKSKDGYEDCSGVGKHKIIFCHLFSL